MDEFEQRAAKAEAEIAALQEKLSVLQGIAEQRQTGTSCTVDEDAVAQLEAEKKELEDKLAAANKQLAKEQYRVGILVRSLEEEENKNFSLQSDLPLDEITAAINKEFHTFTAIFDPDMKFPDLRKSPNLELADFNVNVKAVCARKKIKDANGYAANFIEKYTEYLKGKEGGLVASCSASGAYVNVFLNRALIFKAVISRALSLREDYGRCKVHSGKKVIVEHTSSNPNGPLHIGNLRNSILGAHMAELLKAVGYEVEQHFFVNDLGAQIGVTALGFIRAEERGVTPLLKMDQWIGMIYAIMNTLNELQKLGQTIPDLIARTSEEPHTLQEIVEKNEDAAKTAKLTDFVEVLGDLLSRQPKLVRTLMESLSDCESIQKESAQLNLAYERNEPEAVLIFRKMVMACLSGVQQTLDTYNIRHDVFDFESELGWEGSNDRVMNVLTASPFWVPPTQSNAEGKPEGGHFLLDNFIRAAKYSQGKKGYQKNYPNFYLVRPDLSTLYTFRDVVYSLKKIGNADLVFNIIASEQNLPQEKVSLALQLLCPGQEKKQYHMSYEIVKLIGGSMSGRRARYVLADDVFKDLTVAIRAVMEEKYQEKEGDFDDSFFAEVSEELATATMKFVLLSTGVRHQIQIVVKDVVDPKNSSTASFMLYNYARCASLFRRFSEGVAAGTYPALPCMEHIDWSLLTHDIEWELLFDFTTTFPNLILNIASPNLPQPPQLPEFQVNKLCDFMMRMVQTFSKKYWSKVRILTTDKAEWPAMQARLYLAKAIMTVLDSGLRILTMKPLSKI